MPPIDFVVTWVDGSDPAWLAEKNRYSGEVPQTENYNAPNRYRDLGLLRYYFRAVEKFTPWVRKVFFVTCGQKLEVPQLHMYSTDDAPR